jgi:hypothetical protein
MVAALGTDIALILGIGRRRRRPPDRDDALLPGDEADPDRRRHRCDPDLGVAVARRSLARLYVALAPAKADR